MLTGAGCPSLPAEGTLSFFSTADFYLLFSAVSSCSASCKGCCAVCAHLGPLLLHRKLVAAKWGLSLLKCSAWSLALVSLFVHIDARPLGARLRLDLGAIHLGRTPETPGVLPRLSHSSQSPQIAYTAKQPQMKMRMLSDSEEETVSDTSVVVSSVLHTHSMALTVPVSRKDCSPAKCVITYASIA